MQKRGYVFGIGLFCAALFMAGCGKEGAKLGEETNNASPLISESVKDYSIDFVDYKVSFSAPEGFEALEPSEMGANIVEVSFYNDKMLNITAVYIPTNPLWEDEEIPHTAEEFLEYEDEKVDKEATNISGKGYKGYYAKYKTKSILYSNYELFTENGDRIYFIAPIEPYPYITNIKIESKK